MNVKTNITRTQYADGRSDSVRVEDVYPDALVISGPTERERRIADAIRHATVRDRFGEYVPADVLAAIETQYRENTP